MPYSTPTKQVNSFVKNPHTTNGNIVALVTAVTVTIVHVHCISHYLLKNQHNRPVSQTINVIFLELPKIARLNVDVSKLTRAQMWGTFFLYGSSPSKKDLIHDLCKTNKGIEMAVTVLENVSQDEINWYHESRYWMHVSDEISAHNAAVRE